MKVENNKKYNFKKITPDKGLVLTSWDKKEIKEYSSSTLMYCPMSFDESVLYEISIEEDEQLKEEQRKAYEAEENKRIKEAE